MIMFQNGGILLVESDILDKWGLPTYNVVVGSKVKTFKNGELAYTDAFRYYMDQVMKVEL